MLILIVALVGVVAYLAYSQGATASTVGSATIAYYAQTAGFSSNDLPISVAIALAESSGNPGAINKAEGSYGLWQIHLIAHPEFQGWNLLDAQTNANAAYNVYTAAGQTFNPWTTFTSGKYQSFMEQANQQVSNLSTTSPCVGSS